MSNVSVEQSQLLQENAKDHVDVDVGVGVDVGPSAHGCRHQSGRGSSSARTANCFTLCAIASSISTEALTVAFPSFLFSHSPPTIINFVVGVTVNGDRPRLAGQPFVESVEYYSVHSVSTSSIKC